METNLLIVITRTLELELRIIYLKTINSGGFMNLKLLLRTSATVDHSTEIKTFISSLKTNEIKVNYKLMQYGQNVSTGIKTGDSVSFAGASHTTS